MKLDKAPTGIEGLDEITGGGLPGGRPTLVLGGPGTGKTLLGVEFVVYGALECGEPGVIISFEETMDELSVNMAPLGLDLKHLEAEKKLVVDYMQVEPGAFVEAGTYDLEGLFVRLEDAIQSIQAKRLLIDSLPALFAGFSGTAAVRNAVGRLFRWLKNKDITVVVTAETEHELVREGLGRTLSDCIVVLDLAVVENVATRYIQILKYRGTGHSADRFPFLIDDRGISITPVTTVLPEYVAATERVSTGIPRLDAMLDGAGYYRGSSVLVSGNAGTGKTSVAASFVNAICSRGGRALYFAYEESQNQVVRNLRSIRLDLEPWIEQGLLKFEAMRPTLYGLEMHLVNMQKRVADFKPEAIVIDPISNLVAVGTSTQVKLMLTRLVDFLKVHGITALMTSLTSQREGIPESETGVSSLIDTWIVLRNIESMGEQNRLLYVVKSRGMAHSNQVREFSISGQGIDLVDVYTGPEGVLAGSARILQEMREETAVRDRQRNLARRRLEIERKRKAAEAQIAAIQVELQAAELELEREEMEEQERERLAAESFRRIAEARKAD